MTDRDYHFEMSLPQGKTCGDCVHFERCKWLISAEKTWTNCDFYPNKFIEKKAVNDEG